MTDRQKEYRRLRKLVGTQKKAASILDVNRATICKRERGFLPITTEAMMAIKFLAMTL